MYGLAAKWLDSFRRTGAVAVIGFATLLAFCVASPAFETTAPTAILVDLEKGSVLFEKNADEPVPPASLAKLMTVAVIFNELEKGTISLDDRFTVSEHAWRAGGAASGGSTMFLPLHSEVSVGDLIKGIIIQSGNDAAIVAAEGIAGSVPAFAEMMNRRAEEIGLTASHFTNPHGLPDPEQRVTVRDLATLATYLIREYPDYYPLFSKEEFTFNGITQHNRNPLLGLGADGLKTGHTSQSGYGLVASAERDGRRIVLAMNGMKSAEERSEQAHALMEWGMNDFEEIVLLPAGETVAEATVRGGVAPSVPLAPAEDISVLAPSGSQAEFQRSITRNGPVRAPVAEGRRLGWVRFTRNGETVREEPLYATRSIEPAGLFQRIGDAFLGLVE